MAPALNLMAPSHLSFLLFVLSPIRKLNIEGEICSKVWDRYRRPLVQNTAGSKRSDAFDKEMFLRVLDVFDNGS